MRARLWISAVTALVALGCQKASPPVERVEKVGDAKLDRPAAATPAPPADMAGRANSAATPEELHARQTRPAFTRVGADGVPSMVIRTGFAGVEVDSLEPAVAALRLAAQQLGGYVANATVSSGREQHRTATLEVKVPAARFDDLISGLEPIGRVEQVNVTAEDVSEEYVDVTARIANAKRLEERLIELLATRTGKLQDVLNVERELARVREEIERHEGRLRYLKSRTSLSTLSVAVHEPLPITGNPSAGDVVADAFRRAWRNFLGVVAGGIASLGVLVPIVLAGGAAVVLVRRWRKPAVAQ
ncbi:MAG TPA: DUF4349 domain-containing protein [Gemmatimonadales bacterium]|nr:DUF4349 domain-containing protein [Gemmatimonadales bacterium]